MALPMSASILVVDDQQVATAVTQSILQRLGFSNTDTANSASQAIELIRNRKYDVVFCDWHMAPTDGPELFRQVKAAAGSRRPKFYFLTSDSRWACTVTARDLGAEGLLLKPQRPLELMQRLSQALSVH
jgi:two-component system chemotaxis response regulator CheY